MQVLRRLKIKYCNATAFLHLDKYLLLICQYKTKTTTDIGILKILRLVGQVKIMITTVMIRKNASLEYQSAKVIFLVNLVNKGFFFYLSKWFEPRSISSWYSVIV